MISVDGKDDFKAKATENNRPTSYFNLYYYKELDDYDGDFDDFYNRVKDFINHYKMDGLVIIHSYMGDWNFKKNLPFYSNENGSWRHNNSIHTLSVMTDCEDNNLKFCEDFVREMGIPYNLYAIETDEKMQPRKIKGIPKDAYGTEIDIGDFVAFESKVYKVERYISDKTINRHRMFSKECIVIKSINPNKKLNWEDSVK